MGEVLTTSAKSEAGSPAGKTVYNVPDILPPDNFIINILDEQYSPIKDVEFSYKVDEEETRTGTTDENGILKVTSQSPPSMIDLYLGDNETPPEDFKKP
jgi:hypothetical protein